jgi:hypothetical protein
MMRDKMKDGRWKMKDERWKMKDERWKMKDGYMIKWMIQIIVMNDSNYCEMNDKVDDKIHWRRMIQIVVRWMIRLMIRFIEDEW